MPIPKVLQNRLTLPAIGAPLFIISNPKLVVAQCTAGIVGAFPSLNARPAELLEDWLEEITAALATWDAAHPDQKAAPYAVNLIVHRSNTRLEHDLALCEKYQVPLVITSLGARPEVNAAIHAYGGIVLHDVINNSFARKAIEEANASNACKRALVEGSASDIVYSNLFTGVHGNYLRASIKTAGLDP